MKKLCFAMTALAVLAMTGCAKENAGNGGTATEETKLVVKISADGAGKMRGIESPATNSATDLQGAIDFDRSEIFIIDHNGMVVDHAPLTSDATTTGQQYPNMVANNVSVFVVANMPASDYNSVTTTTSLTAAALTGYAASMVDLNGDDGESWKTVTLANDTGLPTAIGTMTAGAASVSVSISPVVSRLELVQVEAEPYTTNSNSTPFITDFKVCGVWVDDFFPRYTFDGRGMGSGTTAQPTDLMNIDQDVTALDDWAEDYKMGDIAEWESAGSPAVVSPDDTQTAAVTELWGYNVAADALPRLVLHITGVKYTIDGTTVLDDLAGDDYYLTVTGYTVSGAPLTAFTRAHVYRIGTSSNPLVFGMDDLGAVPNANTGTLTVNVSVLGWTIDLPDAQL
jgi:hypothetical protein